MMGKYFGTWQQIGKKYVVYIDPQAVSDHAMSLEGNEGLQSFTLTSSNFKAKVNKDGSIKGTFKLKANFVVENTPGKFILKSI